MYQEVKPERLICKDNTVIPKLDVYAIVVLFNFFITVSKQKAVKKNENKHTPSK